MIQPSSNYKIVRWIVFSLSILTFNSDLLAQKFTLGLKAGPLMSWNVFGDKEDKNDYDTKIGFGYYAAGIIGFPLKNNYSCILEGGYSQKQRIIEFNNGASQNKATYQFVDAALLLRKSFKFELMKNVPSTWYVNVGPHINYWLGGSGTIGSQDSPQEYSILFDQEYLGQLDFNMYLNDVNRWLFGIDIGVGMEAPLSKTRHVNIELRFTSGHTFYGTKTSASYNWILFSDNLQMNEKVLSLTAAYTLDFNLQESKKGRSTKDKEVKRKPVKKKRR